MAGVGRYPLECVEGNARRPKENRLQLLACLLFGRGGKVTFVKVPMPTLISKLGVAAGVVLPAPTATPWRTHDATEGHDLW